MGEEEKKPSIKERLQALKEQLKALMETYGRLAFIIYFTIFFGSIAVFFIAIKAGFEVDSGTGKTGTVVIAYAATKAIQPFRILATLALTPIVAKWTGRQKALDNKNTPAL
ncbi:MAG: hypothetical protein ACI8RZ_000047 [Myxococcota bacterium]